MTMTDDPREALETTALQALEGRPSIPKRAHFVRLCLPQIERCMALGWSAADFAEVLGNHMPMSAKQFSAAVRNARASAGYWSSSRGRVAAPAPNGPKAKADAGSTNPKAFKNWREIDLGLGEKREPPKEEPLKLNVLKGKKPPRPGLGATKAERDAYAAAIIPDTPSNRLLERVMKKDKEKGEE